MSGGPNGGFGGAVHVAQLAADGTLQIARQLRRQRFAADKHLADAGERCAGRRIQQEHPSERRGALQMRDAVMFNLRGN